MKKIKVGIVGVGNMGAHHLRIYMAMQNVEIISLCDINKNNLEQASRICKWATLYREYQEMFMKEKLDAVSIVVPTEFHKDAALAAIKSKIHILLEKPIAQTSAEAKEILSQLEHSEIKCLIGHIERFNPAIHVLKKQLEQGMYGTIYSVQVNRIGVYPIGNVNTDIVKELAIHDIDIIQTLFQTRIKKIFAVQKGNIYSKCNDLLSSILVLENGTIVYLNVNWISPIKKRELIITAEKGLVHLDYINQDLFYYKHPHENPYTDDLLFKRKEGEMVKISVYKEEPLKQELHHFIDCISNNKQPVVSAKDGLEALESAEKVCLAAEKGTVMEL